MITPLLALAKIARDIKLDNVLTSLKKCLDRCLDNEWDSTSSRVQPSKQLSAMNPIDERIKKSCYYDSYYLSLIAACAASGKSLCAADYFVRNANHSMYFRFSPVYEHSAHNIYFHLLPVTRLLNKALDCDLCIVSLLAAESDETCRLEVWDVKIDRQEGWYVLGALKFLWNKTTSVAPVTLTEARTWGRRWVLLDDVFPPEQDNTYLISPMAKLVFLIRILRNANIHCIMLGTNTAILNLVQPPPTPFEHSRQKGYELLCCSHRCLPGYILPSDDAEEALKRVFGEAQVPELLDHVHPWLCSHFLQCLRDSKKVEPAKLIRSISKHIQSDFNRRMLRLTNESIYCMFQPFANEAFPQSLISKGLALLNINRSAEMPPRGIHNTSVEVSIGIGDHRLAELTSSFASALLDPITYAACAGGGRPFAGKRSGSALEVLQQIHRKTKMGDNPLSVDAWKRDGSMLESFGSVVLMISSWSPSQELLSNLAHHCGKTDSRSTDQILASVANKESFVEMLASCMCNLVPVKESEQDHALATALGFCQGYAR